MSTKIDSKLRNFQLQDHSKVSLDFHQLGVELEQLSKALSISIDMLVRTQDVLAFLAGPLLEQEST